MATKLFNGQAYTYSQHQADYGQALVVKRELKKLGFKVRIVIDKSKWSNVRWYNIYIQNNCPVS
jgi:hypothetical protein